MCELFGVSAQKKLCVNVLLANFFSHGREHPNGWGMALFYAGGVSLEKQPEASHKSAYLKQRLRSRIDTDKMIAHIRLATRGSIQYENTHPFVMRDSENRPWTLAHNGTIFEGDVLDSYAGTQIGQTDSERILAFIIDKVNRAQEKRKLSEEERFCLLDKLISEIAPENKLNLLIYDGELMYVHTNYKNSLYFCKKDDGVVISTRPLDYDDWRNVPMNTLIAYQSGKQVYSGICHQHEFFDNEEKFRMLFLDYANL